MTALINQCLTVILEYIDLYNIYWQGTANFCLGLLLTTPQGTQLIFTILEVYLRDHARQLEYSKQYS